MTNTEWVRVKIEEHGWTEEIEAQALLVIRFREQLEEL